MFTFIKRSGILIPKIYQNENFYINIKEFLERNTKQYNSDVYVINKFYVESEKFLLIPRNFPIQQYLTNYVIDDKSHSGKSIIINHNITPRGDVQERAIDYLLKNETGILQLSPGVGKTVITIYMIAERKLKTLIIAHRDSLVDQWRDRILQFTDIDPKEVVRLSSSTFKEDLEKSIIVATTQTFLSLLKRNREEFLISLNKADIGIFVADEVHTSVGAPTFSECSIHMPSKYSYGLSATPYRSDGNEDIIKFHLGDVFSDDDMTGTMSATVTVFLLDYEIDTSKRHYYIHFGGTFQRSRYLNMIRKSKLFLDTVKGLLTRLINDDRETICIIERINLIEELYDWLPVNNKSMFCGTSNADTMKAKITLATPGKCRDGIDAPWKNALLITSPITNIEQLSGRVTRVYQNKKQPIILDMVDYGCRDMRRTFFKRRDFYRKKEWNIQYILVKQTGYTKVEENEALKIISGEEM